MGSSGGSSGSSANQTHTIRYADYIENFHSYLLSQSQSYIGSIAPYSPYSDYIATPTSNAFFGVGYDSSSFPSLYDMYGKFMAGLNLEALWSQMYDSTVYGPEVTDMATAESADLTAELDTVSMPRFQTGMRDIGAVMTSSYSIGKSLLEEGRNRALAKFRAESKYKMIAVMQDRWKSHLAWNEGIIKTYIDMIKHYFTIHQGITEMNYGMKAKNSLWPLTVLDYGRANIGALQGATKSSTSGEEGSSGKSVLGGALSGAAAGGMMGGPMGALAGGVLGGLAGLL